MKLRETLDNHPLVVVLVIVVVSSSITWTIANELLVKPRDFHIQVLRMEMDDLKKSLQRSTVPVSKPNSVAAQPPSSLNQELDAEAQKGDFSPLTMSDYFQRWYDDSKTQLQRQEFENGILGKRVVWQGTIGSVELKSHGQILLTLKDQKKGFHTAFFYFEEHQKGELLKLQPDQRVKISGRVERIIASPILGECRILEILE